jgi:hypothetical protein
LNTWRLSWRESAVAESTPEMPERITRGEHCDDADQ